MPTIVEQIKESPAVPLASKLKKPTSERLVSLDAYRGFIMLMLCSRGFGLNALAEQPGFAWIAAQFNHVPWEGVHFWDLVQPAFMFMVGAAMPFAFARRQAQGATFGQIFRHVAWRTFMLIVLSQVLISISGNKLEFQLINVLSQIAFTYVLCFLIMQTDFRRQALVATLILAGHWALFVLFPGPDGPFSQTDNVGAVIDRAILGRNYSGFYVTINFISSTVTTLFGVWTGLLMMKKRPHAYKIKILTAAAVACFVAGLALEPFNPMIKRLWTASFTLFSTGWVLLMLLVFYGLVEVRRYHRLAFPMMVVGMNSIFIYCVSMILYRWLDQAVAVFTGRFAMIGTLGPIAQATLVLMVMWYFCYWLYQRRIFFKV